jgi:hypothetical protein
MMVSSRIYALVCASGDPRLSALIAALVGDIGVSTVGVYVLYRDRYPQKYPQHHFAGKLVHNRIKHLRSRRFGVADLNRTATRSLDSK